jgi:hypothetical protein
MPEKHLHIICMDVPYPVDYGGVMDIFYKIKTLHRHGICIHLHCFEYGRGASVELNKYCTEVSYYSRRQGHKGFSHNLPYIVCSRADSGMLDRLLKDDYPILIEGIHCTYLLNDSRFGSRKVFLRLHNTEYVYYRQLYRHERSLLKKMFFWHESRLLKGYERKISGKCLILAVSSRDVNTYKKEFVANRIVELPVFVPPAHMQWQQEKGCYCLYHGNLSVSENEEAAIWLLKRVFNDLAIPFVIAGKNPSPRLQRIAAKHSNTCLVADPSEPEMQDIIRKAQVHVLPSFNSTGIKFKLINALLSGRHCVVNAAAVDGSGLGSTCHICSGASTFKQTIGKIYEEPFDAEEMEQRKQLLNSQYNNEKTAQQLIAWIW